MLIAFAALLIGAAAFFLSRSLNLFSFPDFLNSYIFKHLNLSFSKLLNLSFLDSLNSYTLKHLNLFFSTSLKPSDSQTSNLKFLNFLNSLNPFNSQTSDILDSNSSSRSAEIPVINRLKTYTNPKYGFSFQYPEGLTAAEFEEGGGDIVLVQETKATNSTPAPSAFGEAARQEAQIPNDKQNSNSNDSLSNDQTIGFQIFIIPFDEEGPLAPERIRQDLPEMLIQNPQNVIIGKDNIRALIFFSQEPGFGRTREIWFVRNGYLYQAMTYAELDALIGQVMESWEFQ